MAKDHHYQVQVVWTGNEGTGTSAYRAYRRDFTASGPGKPELLGSSDPLFRGDPTRYNPEDLLVVSLSGCHMLSYLHLCADNGLVVSEYVDDAEGKMSLTDGGGGKFVSVVLRPTVTFMGPCNEALARKLHWLAHELCFVASSVNFPVTCEPTIRRG